MFSSDQRFHVSGDRKEALRAVLKLALDMEMDFCMDDHANTKGLIREACTQINVFCVHEDQGLIFGRLYNFDESEPVKGFSKYPMPMSLDMLVEHAIQYLNTSQASRLRSTMGHPGGDGGLNEGWEVHIPMGCHLDHAIIAVRPTWTYYSK